MITAAFATGTPNRNNEESAIDKLRSLDKKARRLDVSLRQAFEAKDFHRIAIVKRQKNLVETELLRCRRALR